MHILVLLWDATHASYTHTHMQRICHWAYMAVKYCWRARSIMELKQRMDYKQIQLDNVWGPGPFCYGWLVCSLAATHVVHTWRLQAKKNIDMHYDELRDLKDELDQSIAAQVPTYQ